MTPPWLRPFNYSDRLTLGLPDDAQMGAQRYRGPLRSRPTQATPAPAAQPAAPVAPTPDPQATPAASPATPAAPSQYRLIEQTGLQLGPSSLLTQETCNFTRHIQTTTYRTEGDTEDRHVSRLLSAEVRPGLRICSMGASLNFSDHGVSGFLKDLGLGLLVGPERSTSASLQLDAHLGEGIMGFLRISGGNLATDGASPLNGAPASPDTTPSAEGGWAAVGAGLTHRTSQSSAGMGELLRVGAQIGLTQLSVQNPSGSTSDEGRTNFRLSLFREGDLAFGFNALHGRFSVELLPNVVNITSNGYVDPMCRGFYCAAGDLLHQSPFIPISLRYDFYPDENSIPSTGSDQWVRYGQTRRITQEEFVYNLASRFVGEAINIGRGVSTHQFIGLQAGLGTEGAGYATSIGQYGTAGIGQFAIGGLRGVSRAGDAVRQGDILRNTYGVDNGRFWSTVGMEAGILLLEGVFTAVNSHSWTAEDYWNCAGSAAGSDAACANNPYANALGSSMRMNFFETLGYGGLLSLNAAGWLGNPRRPDALFWGSTAALAVLGVTGVMTSRKLAGFPGSNGLTGWSIMGDTSPFFNGDYDPISANFLGRAQDANIISSTGSMMFTFAIMQMLAAATHSSETENTVLNAAHPRTVTEPDAAPENPNPAPRPSAQRTPHPREEGASAPHAVRAGSSVRLRSARVTPQVGGISASVEGTFN